MPGSFEDIPMFMGVEYFAQLVHRNPDTVRRSLRRGTIPGKKIDGSWLICRDEVFGGMVRPRATRPPVEDGLAELAAIRVRLG